MLPVVIIRNIMKKCIKINKNIQQEISELNQFFEDMEKSLFTEYSEKDFEDMEKDYTLSEKKKERFNYGR